DGDASFGPLPLARRFAPGPPLPSAPLTTPPLRPFAAAAPEPGVSAVDAGSSAPPTPAEQPSPSGRDVDASPLDTERPTSASPAVPLESSDHGGGRGADGGAVGA